MSDALAAKRIRAARTTRRFPVVLDMLERGDLHLSAINILSKHLTVENHLDVLARAKHRSARDLEILAAELAPQPDARSCLALVPTAPSVEALFEKSVRERAVEAPAPRTTPADASAPKGRTIPRAVVRKGWRRDGGCCAFVSASGKRCGSTHFVQVHHIVPAA